MKATSTWQIAREFTHGDQAPAAPADNATVPPAAAPEGPADAAAAPRTGGHRRFGWLPADPAGGRPHNHLLDPAEAPYLRAAIEMIMAGKSERTVTRWLVGAGVPTVRGGAWTGTTVRNMVSNPAVCGYRAPAGELLLDPRTGRPAVGGWETVATPEEWRRVLGRYGSPSGRGQDAGPGGGRTPERRQVRQTRKYLLSGFLRCGRVDPRSGEPCAATLAGNPVTRGTPHGAYACASPACRGLARRMDMVDTIVTGLVLDVLERRYGGRSAAAEPLLGGFTRARWAEFDLRQKRIAIGTVLETVLVRPLPGGRSTRAPFDPGLLEAVWRPEGAGT